MKAPSAMMIHHFVVAVCYFGAFWSLNAQWDALLGSEGILPVGSFTERVAQYHGLDTKMSNAIDLVFRTGSIVFLSDKIGVSTEALCQAILVCGLITSSILTVSIVVVGRRGSICCSLGFALVWILYHSLVVVGQNFLSFQWDLLLGEVGLLCVLSSLHPEFTPMKLMHRFLAFKLMFMSGMTKVQAQCPTWSDLTALEYHFATQPLPTPLSWWAHQLPPTLLRFGVLMTLVIEIPVTLLLVVPVRSARRVGVMMQLLLQLSIAITGNYTFFNVLTASLMLPSWSDDRLIDVCDNGDMRLSGEKNARSNNGTMGLGMKALNRITQIVNTVSYHVAVTYTMTFALLFVLDSASWRQVLSHALLSWKSLSNLAGVVISHYRNIAIPRLSSSFICLIHALTGNISSFSASSCDIMWDGSGLRTSIRYKELESMVPTFIICALGACFIGILHGLCQILVMITSFFRKSQVNRPLGLLCLLSRLASLLIAVVMIGLSLTTFDSLRQGLLARDLPGYFPRTLDVASVRLKPKDAVSSLIKLSQTLQPLRPVNAYGLFRRMTGVAPRDEEATAKATIASFPRIGTENDHTPYGYAPSLVARPELVIEGWYESRGDGDSNESGWREIHFAYKPGALSEMPKWVAPHQPRLDWQMWFAALGTYQNNPWLVHVLYKILHKGDTIWSLLDTAEAHFSDGAEDSSNALWEQGRRPPSKVRVLLYHYDFTRIATVWAQLSSRASDRVSLQKKGTATDRRWWHRVYQGLYLDSLDLDNDSVRSFLQANGLIVQPSETNRAKHVGAEATYSFVDCVNMIDKGTDDKDKRILSQMLGLFVCGGVRLRRYLLSQSYSMTAYSPRNEL